MHAFHNRVCGSTHSQMIPQFRQASALGCTAQKTVVPDAHKALWQDVLRKPTHELQLCKFHAPFTPLTPIIFIAKANLPLTNLLQPVVADGNFVAVSPQILHHLSGPAKRTLGIHHPGF